MSGGCAGSGKLDINMRRGDCAPLDFLPVGLAGRDLPVRWLEFFETENRKPAWSVWLAHASNGKREWLITITYHRERFDMLAGTGGHHDPQRELAERVTFALANAMASQRPAAMGRRYWAWALPHIESAARDQANWAAVSWLIDDVYRDARVWEFGGGWAGFTTSAASVYVALLGSGVSPDGWRLSSISDGSAYGFDLSLPLRLSMLRAGRGDG